MDNKEKLVKEIKPYFSFMYELLMPTGRKIKSSLLLMFIFFICNIFILVNKDILLINVINNISLYIILMIASFLLLLFSIAKIIFHVVMQKMQYEHITYRFYETYMVYEDNFLNQHKKNILYSNIKEVEIRRTIWDRINGFGVVVVYTNAENKRNNGLVIYGLKNPNECYEFIDGIINKTKSTDLDITENERSMDKITNKIESYNVENVEKEEKIEGQKEENIENINKEIDYERKEEEFKNSLKEIK